MRARAEDRVALLPSRVDKPRRRMVTMTSTSEAFVWVWLGQCRAGPAGRLELRSDGLWFGYGRGYLARHDAISLAPSLPTTDGVRSGR